MKNTKLRIAIVGLRHGEEHLTHYHGHPDVEVAGICDVSEPLVRKIGAQYGVPPEGWFTDYEEMLRRAQPEAVYVMTPVPLHAEMSIRALEAGCHVLVAKSVCRTLAEGEAMLAARDKAGKELFVGFQMHYAPVYQHVREHLGDAEFGEVHGAWVQFHYPSYSAAPGNWQNRMESLGGSLLDCAIHPMDVLLYLLDRPWRRVFASGRQFIPGPPERDTMDSATVLIDLDNDVRITFDFTPSYGYCYTRTGILGSEGKFEIEHWEPNGAGHVRFHGHSKLPDPVRIYVPPKEASIGHIGAVEQSLQFLDVCRGLARSLNPMESALESLAMQQAIILALRRESWVSREEITDKRWR